MPNRFSPITVYLDSNVLFSASYVEDHEFLEFWRMYGVTTATSPYVIGEVRRNLRSEAQSIRFEDLIRKMLQVSDGPIDAIPSGITLVKKDQAVLASAISASMDYLMTGDINHFGKLYGTRVSHVKIISPPQFRSRYAYRLII